MAEPFREEAFGPYRLTHLLGQGGMATVYRALRSGPMGFAKEVAIKRLHDKLNDNDAVLKALINEARLGGQLKHRNIVEVYEFNKVDEQYFMAMEFVDGWTLDTVFELAKEHELPVPPEVVFDLMEQVCEGLHYAHTLESLEGEEVRLVHRDLKPANIIVARDGTAKVMDFGIAKAATNLFKTTMADTTKGTPHYMSPEQVAGEADLTRASDIFALGTVIYELVQGQLLFGGDSLVAVLFAVAQANVADKVAAVDAQVPGLSPILARCLAKDPAERFASAAQLGEALHSLRRTMDSDVTVRDYVHRLRARVLDAKEGRAPADDEPQFATLIQKAPPKPENPDALDEARRAADAAIGEWGTKEALDQFAGTKEALDQFAGGGPGAPPPGAGDELDPFASKPGDPGDLKQTRLVGPGAVDAAAARPSGPGAKDGAISPQREGDYDETRLFTAADAPEAKRRRTVGALVIAGLGLGAVAGAWFALPALMPPPEQPTPSATSGAAPVPAATPTPEPTPEAEEPAVAELGTAERARRQEHRQRGDVRRERRGDQGSATPRPAAAPEPTATPRPTPKAAATPAPPPAPTATPAPVAMLGGGGSGKLLIKASEPWAQIWIDGANTGKRTPLAGGLELPAGKHTVELRCVECSGNPTARKTVTIEAGQRLVLPKYDFASKSWSP